jgi:nucleotide-binding universal stress UspA family protein
MPSGMLVAAPWIVGLDLTSRSRGAVAFAAWLRAAAGAPVHGLHVLVRASAFAADDAELAAARGRVAARHPDAFDAVEVAVAASAEEGLAAAGERAAAVVLGRAARAEERRVVRLGKVARRLLRQLPAPVVVVPPELTAVAPGPVLLATDLAPTSAAAARFAAAFAAAHGRTLELLHVAPAEHEDLIDELEPSWRAERDAQHARVAAELDEWALAHGVADRPRRALYGDVVEHVLAAAERHQAAMIVVGSRRLTPAARLFATSTASALASHAPCPVAVVAPG